MKYLRSPECFIDRKKKRYNTREAVGSREERLRFVFQKCFNGIDFCCSMKHVKCDRFIEQIRFGKCAVEAAVFRTHALKYDKEGEKIKWENRRRRTRRRRRRWMKLSSQTERRTDASCYLRRM